MATNIDSLDQWVNTYTDTLFSWAYHKVSDAELAKDLVQDTFLAAAEKMDGFKGDSSPKTWLFSILNHKVIDYYRKKSRKEISYNQDDFLRYFTEDGSWRKDKQPESWDEENENLLDNYDFKRVLAMCLEALPESWHTTVKYKYLMNKKGDEICKELNITPSNYWQLIHRAKLQLRDCINTNWFNN